MEKVSGRYMCDSDDNVSSRFLILALMGCNNGRYMCDSDDSVG